MRPEETAPWKPESAPQAMVMNRNGKRLPEKVGPFDWLASMLIPGMLTCGFETAMPTTSSANVPIFINVDR